MQILTRRHQARQIYLPAAFLLSAAYASQLPQELPGVATRRPKRPCRIAKATAGKREAGWCVLFCLALSHLGPKTSPQPYLPPTHPLHPTPCQHPPAMVRYFWRRAPAGAAASRGALSLPVRSVRSGACPASGVHGRPAECGPRRAGGRSRNRTPVTLGTADCRAASAPR